MGLLMLELVVLFLDLEIREFLKKSLLFIIDNKYFRSFFDNAIQPNVGS